MTNPACYTRLELLSFDRIAFAHSLVSGNYRYQLDNRGYGIYGVTPPDGGVLEIGFVEQNPMRFSGAQGEFFLEENSIFIIPPQCSFSIRACNEGLHRHTSAEFLVRCRSRQVQAYQPPEGKTVTLPLCIPPSTENSELFALIRAIATAKTAEPRRSYFEECADFMNLLHKLTQRLETHGASSVSPGNRRHCARAKAYISENIGRRISVSDVAAAVGVSKNYLTNVFSGSEGVPLMEYINRSKLSHMLMLTRRYGYTLQQAGEQVGYSDVNYISRIFKRYYGMTITEYKRSISQK